MSGIDDVCCFCGIELCGKEHPNEADFVKLAKQEAPRILKNMKAGIRPDILDRILLKMAGIKVPKWRKSRKTS